MTLAMAKRKPVSREERVPPTPETLARLVPDRVVLLFGEGRIRQEQLDAAEEIRDIWDHLLAGTSPMRNFEAYSRARIDPLERLPARLQRAWAERYGSWANELGPEVQRVVLPVVVENWWPETAMLQAYVLERLRKALWRYCEMAGWVKPRRVR